LALRRNLNWELEYDWEVWNRTFREATRTNEHSVRGRLNYKPRTGVALKEKDAQTTEGPKVEKPTQAQDQTKEPAQAQEQPKGDAAAGKALYTQFCQKCHAPGGEGVAKMYKLVKAKIVHLGSKEAQDKSDDFIRKSMTAGCCNPGNKMEKVTEPRPLTSEEVDAILAFVRTLKQ
jgi:mono/diheme cytochrome c family protein